MPHTRSGAGGQQQPAISLRRRWINLVAALGIAPRFRSGLHRSTPATLASGGGKKKERRKEKQTFPPAVDHVPYGTHPTSAVWTRKRGGIGTGAPCSISHRALTTACGFGKRSFGQDGFRRWPCPKGQWREACRHVGEYGGDTSVALFRAQRLDGWGLYRGGHSGESSRPQIHVLCAQAWPCSTR